MMRRASVALAFLVAMSSAGFAQAPGSQNTSTPWVMDGLLNPLLSGCQLPQAFVKFHDELKASTAVAPSGGGITYRYTAPFADKIGDIKAAKEGEKWTFNSTLTNATWKGLKLNVLEYEAQGAEPRVIMVQFDVPADAVKDTFFSLVSASQQILARAGKGGSTSIRDFQGRPAIICRVDSGLTVVAGIPVTEAPANPSPQPQQAGNFDSKRIEDLLDKRTSQRQTFSPFDAAPLLDPLLAGCSLTGGLRDHNFDLLEEADKPGYKPNAPRDTRIAQNTSRVIMAQPGGDRFVVSVMENTFWRGLKVDAIVYERLRSTGHWRVLVQFGESPEQLKNVLGQDLYASQGLVSGPNSGVQTDIITFGGRGALTCQSSSGPWISQIPNDGDNPPRQLVELKNPYVAPRRTETTTHDRQWLFSEQKDGASLMYAAPNSDDIVIGFACSRGLKPIEARSFFNIPGVKDGVAVQLTLRSGSKSLSLNGMGEFNEMTDSSDIVAKGGSMAQLKAVLAVGSRLMVVAKGKSNPVPLDGVMKQFREFEALCATPPADPARPKNLSEDEMKELLYGRGGAPAAAPPAAPPHTPAPQPVAVTNSGYGTLHVCNKTSKTMSLFTAHPKEANSTEWIVQGWGTIKGSSCGDFVVPNGLVHYYAQTETKNWGGKDAYYCVTAKPFEKKVFKGEKCVSGEMRLGANEVYVEGTYNLNLVP
ncbi:DUF1036 domain-containing protein [Xanthobacter sp. VTT E-85241]|uniref:DUF1036 domain-containing protein n=1 Tax=Roseixanthobacter finlandensis TaxID=3119922 RepID=UPI00372811B1